MDLINVFFNHSWYQIISLFAAHALFDSLLSSGGGAGGTPKILETTGRMIMKFLPDVKLSEFSDAYRPLLVSSFLRSVSIEVLYEL